MELVRLYHGTCQIAAKGIAAEGFEFANVDAELRRVAGLYGVDVRSLRDRARASYAFNRPPGTMSLCRTREQAWAYAGFLGGETRRELMAAALRIRDPRLSVADAEWKARQQLRSPGVIVVVEFPFAAIEHALSRPRGRRAPWTFDDWQEHDQAFGGGGNRDISLPRPQLEWIVGEEPVEAALRDGDVKRLVDLPDHVWRLLHLDGPPTIMGDPAADGLWAESVLRDWLATHGVELPPLSHTSRIP